MAVTINLLHFMHGESYFLDYIMDATNLFVKSNFFSSRIKAIYKFV